MIRLRPTLAYAPLLALLFAAQAPAQSPGNSVSLAPADTWSQVDHGSASTGGASLADNGPAAGKAPADDGSGAEPETGDLLSRLDKAKPSKASILDRIKGWLGSGGSAARQASKAYADGDYDLALQKLAEAQLDNPGSQALAYNAGNAQFRKRKYPEAIASYKKALQGSDAGLASSAYYNLGNAFFRKGEAAILSGKQEGIEDYREAMASYKKSLEIRPENKDAKRNIEVVQARIKELLERQKQEQQQNPGTPQKPPEPSEAAKQALARALQLVSERRYAEAKALLEDVIQKDKTAISFQTHVQKIDDVLSILRGETPAPPRSQDPRANQGGVGVI